MLCKVKDTIFLCASFIELLAAISLSSFFFVGLNGVPICMVNDGWSVLTPLSPHPMIKGQLSTTILGVPGAHMPIGDPHSNLVPRLTVG